MKIVEQNKMKPESVTTLNDIPVGAIFRGSVMGACSGEWASVIRLICWMIVGHLADLATTWYALGLGCREMNPVFYVAGFAGLVGVKVIVLAWIVWLDRQGLVRMAAFAGFAAAVWNLLVIGVLGC